jgi:hypothetical protein
MSQLLGIFLLTILLWSSTAYSASPPYQISISTPVDVVQTGDNISLNITDTNYSGQELWVSYLVERFNIKVWREDGRPVNFTKEGRFLHGQQSGKDIQEDENWWDRSKGNGHMAGLNPGEQLEEQVLVNQIYDMSTPGTYLMQIQGSVPPFPPGFPVKSNMIAVTVTN